MRTSEVAGDLLVACRALLTPGEQQRLFAFKFEANRHEYLVTRALCRGLLSRRMGRSPGALEFQHNPFGRPELDPPSELRFNLANTSDMVVCGIVLERDIGVDAEPISRSDQILEVAAAICTPAELRQLARLDVQSKRAYAVRLWTSKEAYMKARGMGMSIPPLSIELDIDLATDRVGFVCASDPAPARWAFTVLNVDDHLVTICMERRAGDDDSVRAHHTDLRTLLFA